MNLHIKHNYIVKLEALDDYTLIASFPCNIFLDIPSTTALITLEDDGLIIETEEFSEKINCKDYLRRPILFKIIGLSTLIRDMSTKLIVNSNEIDKLAGPEDLKKEKELHQLFVQELDKDDHGDYHTDDLEDLLKKGIIL